MNQKDVTRALLNSRQALSCETAKEEKDKKHKPVREESFFFSALARLIFQKNDFRYIDIIVDPNSRRRKRNVPKGYSRSSIFFF